MLVIEGFFSTRATIFSGESKYAGARRDSEYAVCRVAILARSVSYASSMVCACGVWDALAHKVAGEIVKGGAGAGDVSACGEAKRETKFFVCQAEI